MPTEIKTKQTFGSADVAHVSPQFREDVPRAMNIVITFEEALKLHLAIGQTLAKLNSYNRATKDGKRSAVNLCVYPHVIRISVNEAKLPRG
ncbi:MAG: hypothetical protein KF841_07840 [Phycisphaerae bacterium]|nr:hypothetical protein [Phycisphaerae bacterium]